MICKHNPISFSVHSFILGKEISTCNLHVCVCGCRRVTETRFFFQTLQIITTAVNLMLLDFVYQFVSVQQTEEDADFLRYFTTIFRLRKMFIYS